MHSLRLDDYQYTPLKRPSAKTYLFRAETEQQEDGRWHVWIEALPSCAAVGYTKEEALRNIHGAVEIYVRDMEKVGEVLPRSVPVHIIDEPVVAVTL